MMAKHVTRKQYDLYSRILDCLKINPPVKGDKFFKEDKELYCRLEAETTDFVVSFVIREEDGSWKSNKKGHIVFKEYNEDGEPWISTVSTFKNRFDILDLEE